MGGGFGASFLAGEEGCWRGRKLSCGGVSFCAVEEAFLRWSKLSCGGISFQGAQISADSDVYPRALDVSKNAKFRSRQLVKAWRFQRHRKDRVRRKMPQEHRSRKLPKEKRGCNDSLLVFVFSLRHTMFSGHGKNGKWNDGINGWRAGNPEIKRGIQQNLLCFG